MPHYCVDRIARLLNEDAKSVKGARVLILGVAYKADIDDVRESPALLIIEQLRKKGAVVAYHDPHVPDLGEEIEGELQSVALTEGEIARADCVVILTAHGAFDWPWIGQRARLIVDTRNAMNGAAVSGTLVKA